MTDQSSAPIWPRTFRLPSSSTELPASPRTKAWPHAPVHRLAEAAVYMVTAGTLHKHPWFDSPDHRNLLERLLLEEAHSHEWQLEAWAVFSNHYHFVARGNPASSNLRDLVRTLHSRSARLLNQDLGKLGTQVWFNFWDTRLTYQHSYLARLNYVHQNAVRHGLVSVARAYPWCSAAWFERVASPAQIKTIYGLKIDRLNVKDDF